jgi:hypothetical protein
MAAVSPTKATAAVKFVASKDKKSLLRAIPVALKSGSVPVIGADMKSLPLTELPGIAQLLSLTDEKLVEEHWHAIEEFVLCVVGHTKDVKQKLKVAKQKLAELKGADYEDIEEMLAEFNRRFDACSSWLGSEVEVDYEKVQMFVGKCSSSVKIEYADFISPKYNGEGVDEMSIEWGEFEELIRKVWKAAVMKSQIRDELGVGVDAGTVPDHTCFLL